MKQIVLTILLICSWLLTFSQTKWHPYAGVHISMDGGGYYVGPSFQLGTDYKLKNQTTFSSYIHYFGNKLNEKYNDGSFENGKYRSMIMCVLIQKYFSQNILKSWFLAGGLALQRTTHDYISDIDEEHSKRTILAGAIRFGYTTNAFSVEINGVGPHSGRIGDAADNIHLLEILTQLSLGVRFIL